MDDVEPRVIWREGCPLHVWDVGPRDAPCVVLTHGVLMDHQVFAPQVEALSSRYRVVTWDLRGHGRSRPMAGFDLDLVSDDLLATMDALDIGSAAFVGHSMGGFVAQIAAERAPSRCWALVAFATARLGDRPAFLRWGAPLSAVGFRAVPGIAIQSLVAFGSGLRASTKWDALRAARAVPKSDFDAIWASMIRDLDRPSLDLDVPTLLVYGEADRRVAFGALKILMRRWAARDGRARQVVIPRAGHNAHRDNAAAFDEALLGFLDEHAATRSSSPQGEVQT